MSDWDLLLTDARIASMCPGGDEYGTVEDGVVAIRDGLIDWIGPASRCPDGSANERRSLDGRWLTPALIDCHTHLVFGGDRVVAVVDLPGVAVVDTPDALLIVPRESSEKVRAVVDRLKSGRRDDLL